MVKKNTLHPPLPIDEADILLSQRATLKVDVSFMARCLREFYARKELCQTCVAGDKECPYDQDPIACIYGGDTIN